MSRTYRRPVVSGSIAVGVLCVSAGVWLALREGVTPLVTPTNVAADTLKVRPTATAVEPPDNSGSVNPSEVLAQAEAQMPQSLSDKAIALTGFIGMSLEIGPGKALTLTVNPTDVLRNQGLMLLGATARLMGIGFAPMPVSATQPYVGAPITISLADALNALGGGDAASLVGGVPLFLEVTTTDTAGQAHVTRTPFEVTNRDLQADATAVVELPPMAPSAIN